MTTGTIVFPIDADGMVEIADHTRIAADMLLAQMLAKGWVAWRDGDYIKVNKDMPQQVFPGYTQDITLSGPVASTGPLWAKQHAAEYRDTPPECTWQGICPSCKKASDVRWVGYRSQVHCPACGDVVATMPDASE